MGGAVPEDFHPFCTTLRLLVMMQYLEGKAASARNYQKRLAQKRYRSVEYAHSHVVELLELVVLQPHAHSRILQPADRQLPLPKLVELVKHAQRHACKHTCSTSCQILQREGWN